ncbi:MAG TPA: phosphoenolpyruvate carboxylase, partial [Pyrinomonadaceae bacterium]|nr:phosphoenolpyruvate carboxylase [Pyrinomonadaceae bacterium]
MTQNQTNALERFQNFVAVKFQLYNSLFLSLPFDRVEKTGILLSLFLSNCEEGFAEKKDTPQIVEEFFSHHASIKTETEKIDLLLRFVQYAERQVVLFDALEDAAFREVNDMQGAGTLKHLESIVPQNKKQFELEEKLRDFNVRLVLTAHPTQFYPGSVLGIINDLTQAIAENNIANINTYLQQLGRTPFIKEQKPTPFDEAVSLIWYLENVFYAAAGNIVSELNSFVAENTAPIKLGFWSGGDRDGNPFVKVETTLQVAGALQNSLLRCYYRDVRGLKRRLTFAGVENIVSGIEQKLYQNLYATEQITGLTKQEMFEPLIEIRRILLEKHDGLFVHLVNDLIYKVELFGLFFASLDIRQEASVHARILEYIASHSEVLPSNYQSLTDEQKIETLLNVRQSLNADAFEDELVKDTLETIAAVKTIQRQNSAAGCERYIISQCQTALNAVEVYGLFLLAGWQAEEMSVDIVPLFETVSDLQNAANVMRQLYEIPAYRGHLARRGDTQTIMLGFSDGTKDGGYLMANWSIYKAKDELTKISKQFGVDVIFFDGRGGPPARGGGKTHKFYSSMGENISNKAIELTVQGQTVSSNFGTIDAAQFNIEQLLHAGIYNHISSVKETTFSPGEENLMRQLADESYKSYEELKNHTAFLDYLLHASPLRFYSETNIGSRPAKRGSANKLELKDLRAIPFVGAWSQLKQNVPGYYGVGTAFQKIEASGKLDEVKAMYQQNAFFKALMDNCEMAMEKSFFPLTRFLSNHPVFGELWRKIYDEYKLTRDYLLLISDKDELMTDYPVDRQSIQMRERIMLPLTTIQQYALAKTRDLDESQSEIKKAYEKLIMRCSFGIINAGRNSA